MRRTGGRRPLATAIGLVLLAAGLASGPAPAGAAPTDSDTLVFVDGSSGGISLARNGQVAHVQHVAARDTVLEGDFSAAPGTDLFLNSAGSAPDGIVHVAPTGTTATTSFRPEAVSGSYPQAMVGDFDANGLDDIFWYGSGSSSPESIWLFQPDGSHTTVWTAVSGQFLPFVMDTDGDGYDDIVWYGYGPKPDSIWLFGPGAGHTKRSLTVNGRYDPLVGHFGGVPGGGDQEQVIWYDSLGPDSVWTFTATGRTTRTLPNEDDAWPIVGDFAGNDHDAVYWYRPGAAQETTTGFTDGGGTLQVDVPQVRGDYEPVVGDFDGDGEVDIAWTWDGKAIIWHTQTTLLTYEQSYVDTGEREAWWVAVARPTVAAS